MINDILTRLPKDFPWAASIRHYPVVDSTNTLAKSLAAQGAPHGTVLIADSQTGGRGRMGRSFHSPAGSGIYLSVILRPQCHASQLMHLTCATAVAMCGAIKVSCGVRPGIKWINDLVFNGKKLGGILTELSLNADGTVAYAVVGVGINCTQKTSDFPQDIQDIATSLSAVSDIPVSRSCVAAAMIRSLEEMSRELFTRKEPIMEFYRSRCITLGKYVCVFSGDTVRHGTAEDMDDDGALLIRFDDGHTETVGAGEVSIRGMYGYI